MSNLSQIDFCAAHPTSNPARLTLKSLIICTYFYFIPVNNHAKILLLLSSRQGSSLV